MGVKLRKIHEILTHFLEIFAAICKIFQNLMILPQNFDPKKKNINRDHWV